MEQWNHVLQCVIFWWRAFSHCPTACTQHVVCIAEQVCVAATSTFPSKVTYYASSESANAVGISNPCSVAAGQITQDYDITCALKCEDGYLGNPTLYCSHGSNKLVVAGTPEYKDEACTRTCDCLYGQIMCCDLLPLHTIIDCLECVFHSAAQQCEIDTQHADFPGELEFLDPSASSTNKCSGTTFNLTAIGNSTDTECDLQCKDGYYNDTEAVKISCEPNLNQMLPDGITQYVRCSSTWFVLWHNFWHHLVWRLVG